MAKINVIEPKASNTVQSPLVPLVPYPRELSLKKGNFLLSKSTPLQIDSLQIKKWFQSRLESLESGKKFPLVAKISSSSLPIKTGEATLPAEGYHLLIEPERLTIEAVDEAGLFYALQTVLQLAGDLFYQNDPFAVDNATPLKSALLPALEIWDWPRFGWRGLHLDVSRHFFSVNYIKRYIDFIAHHKGNRFHWHLTDDQGWRIEIKGWPLLTQKGSVRKASTLTPFLAPLKVMDEKEHRGFYTQDEIREVVAYAQERFVTVVPEIDVPGHSAAAVHAYPHLGCHPEEKSEVSVSAGGVSSHILNAGDEARSFVKSVLDEVLELFPGRWIHIGGDEAPLIQWVGSKKTERQMNERGISSEKELFLDFLNEISAYVIQKGRRVIGWNDMYSPNMDRAVIVMPWFKKQNRQAALNDGHDVIPVNQSHLYFDHPEQFAHEPVNIGFFPVSQKAVYDYQLLAPDATEGDRLRTLGAEGLLWTEFIRTGAHADYMVYPRFCVLAEKLWNGGNEPFDFFKRRLWWHQLRLASASLFSRLNVPYQKTGKAIFKNGEVCFDFHLNLGQPTNRYKKVCLQFTLKALRHFVRLDSVELWQGEDCLGVIEREAFSGQVEVFPIYSFLIDLEEAEKWSGQGSFRLKGKGHSLKGGGGLIRLYCRSLWGQGGS